MCPILAPARLETYIAIFNTGVEAIAVELDLVQPPLAGGGCINARGELRLYEVRRPRGLFF